MPVEGGGGMSRDYPPEYDYPEICEVCGLEVNECICPPCSVCGTHGDPNCYREGPYGHDMIKSAAQQIEYQKFLVAEAKARWQEECQILDYLEEQAAHKGS